MIKVMRGDRPAEFRRDLGKVKQFKAIQFNIPGGAMDGGRYYVEHTVGELVDIADELRATVEIPRHAAEASDLVKGYHDEMAQRPLRRVKRSSFGPLNRIQRS
ncbi:MAG: hypothetical protein Q7J84_15855 [Sulfuricaulis sp.]|nr:hypothetical protein [Sulfuricaulis sp.]